MIVSTEFQTPSIVCNHMASLLWEHTTSLFPEVLEPTPGEGNLIKALSGSGANTVQPAGDFWLDYDKLIKDLEFFDAVVMNPPFTPAAEGYKFLYAAMELSNLIVALLPWFVLVNSESRTKRIIDFGLKSVTHLPRKAFPGSRTQTCILVLERHYRGSIEFKHFTW